MELLVRWEADAALSGLAVGGVDDQLQRGPVHQRGGLGEFDMRDGRAVFDQHDYGDLACLDMIPAGGIDFAGLVVDPFAAGQVDAARCDAFEERGNKDVGTEEVLIIDEPGAGVVGVFDE